uniref:Uncharacterized protein n=1 Tax=Octopus bimaculoides TaxID=37653 RepID=A0A0L8FQC2_OCTBM
MIFNPKRLSAKTSIKFKLELTKSSLSVLQVDQSRIPID